MINIPNYGLLDPKPSGPSGFLTRDMLWAAVPFGKKFVILHNGEQVHTANNLDTAKAFIDKKVKELKLEQKKKEKALKKTPKKE